MPRINNAGLDNQAVQEVNVVADEVLNEQDIAHYWADDMLREEDDARLRAELEGMDRAEQNRNEEQFRWGTAHDALNANPAGEVRIQGGFVNVRMEDLGIGRAPQPEPPIPEVAPNAANFEAIRRLMNDRLLGENGRVGLPNRSMRRGERVVAVAGGAHIPHNIAQEPEQQPMVVRKQPVPRVKVAPVKKLSYPEDGVFHPGGRRFARALDIKEDSYFRNYGYIETIRKYKDLEWKEKEKPVNEDEEVILTISELADHYATEECRSAITNFDIKTHNKEYQVAYKKHVKVVASFKRNKNG